MKKLVLLLLLSNSIIFNSSSSETSDLNQQIISVQKTVEGIKKDALILLKRLEAAKKMSEAQIVARMINEINNLANMLQKLETDSLNYNKSFPFVVNDFEEIVSNP